MHNTGASRRGGRGGPSWGFSRGSQLVSRRPRKAYHLRRATFSLLATSTTRWTTAFVARPLYAATSGWSSGMAVGSTPSFTGGDPVRLYFSPTTILTTILESCVRTINHTKKVPASVLIEIARKLISLRQTSPPLLLAR